MVRAVRQQQPDAVFHLGDCERDTQRLEKEFPDLPLYRVCGNCDREPVNPEVLQLTLDGVKFFLTHGHRYSVKYTLDALLNAAYFAGADMVLFGHTHRAVSETMQGLYVVNPGTAGPSALYGTRPAKSSRPEWSVTDMKDLDALKNQLARDGRLQRLQEIADSTDGQKLAGALDAQKIEQAARAGDTETLRQILTQVLSTDTGQRLAGKVKDAMQDG